MNSDASAHSFPSDLEDHIEEYTREDYWANYDFTELLEDITCTVYKYYTTAQEIQCALQTAAEEENVTWFAPLRLWNTNVIKYQIAESPFITKNIRFKTSNDKTKNSVSHRLSSVYYFITTSLVQS